MAGAGRADRAGDVGDRGEVGDGVRGGRFEPKAVSRALLSGKAMLKRDRPRRELLFDARSLE
jgi:hypothetical protein